MQIHFVDYLTASLKPKFLRLLPAEHFALPVDTFVLLPRFSFTILVSSQCSLPCSWTTSQFCLLLTSQRCPSVDAILPVYFCIFVSSFLHLLVKYYFLSIYLWTPTIKYIFVCCCICFYSSLLWSLRWSVFDIERLWCTSHSLVQDYYRRSIPRQ